MAKQKKLFKSIEGNVITIKEAVTNETMIFDCALLPAEIKAKLMPFGAGHKLGDSAAGESGPDAVASIKAVWKGLMEGNWSVRGPAGEKVSLAAVESGIEKLPPKEQDAARALLLKLGILKLAPAVDPNAPKATPAAGPAVGAKK
jgi:hypothetical protein